MPEEIMEGVNPTRMELLEIKKKQVLAKKGHKLLEEKRDALVERFFSIIDKRNELRKEINQTFVDAMRSLIQAQMLLGEQAVQRYTELHQDIGDIDFSTDNIMGVSIPTITMDQLQPIEQPLYSFVHTNAALDDAQLKFSGLTMKLLELSELEGTIKSLSVEIEKTKRRVNVLENTLIPKLEATVKYISMQLDEREREDFFRRKRIKAIMEKQKKP